MSTVAQSPSPFYTRLYSEIKARKIRKRIAIYVSTGLTALGLANLLVSVYRLPRFMLDTVLILFICGLPCAAIAAWNHARRREQERRWPEIAAYGFFLALAFVLIIRAAQPQPHAAATAEAKSLAVLPFTNMSDSRDDEYFSDGVTEDIITQLSKIADLRVISRTSTMSYKDAPRNIREIGRELNVAYVLEGSVRRAGNRVRIVGQLIDTNGDQHVWAETYDRDLQDVFAIQSDVAQSIARALEAVLSPAEIARIRKQSTSNLDAYAFYLRGREYYYRYTKEDNDRAIAFFRKALAADPAYALAYAGLGDAYGQCYNRYALGVEWSDSAVAASRQAIALDPGLAEGYKALGLALETKGKTADALQQYYKAVELNPNYAPVVANIGSLNFSVGRYDEALPWVKKAVRLQPVSALNHSLVGLQYFSLGLDSAAGIWLEKARSLQPEAPFPAILLIYIDLYQGRRSQARTRAEELLKARPDEGGALEAAGDVELLDGKFDRARHFYERACAYAGVESPPGARLAYALLQAGKRDSAGAILAQIVAAFEARDRRYPEGSQIPYVLSQAYALQRKNDRSVRWLSSAIDNGYSDYRWASIDPILEEVRSTPAGARTLLVLKERYDRMRAKVIQGEQ